MTKMVLVFRVFIDFQVVNTPNFCSGIFLNFFFVFLFMRLYIAAVVSRPRLFRRFHCRYEYRRPYRLHRHCRRYHYRRRSYRRYRSCSPFPLKFQQRVRACFLGVGSSGRPFLGPASFLFPSLTHLEPRSISSKIVNYRGKARLRLFREGLNA